MSDAVEAARRVVDGKQMHHGDALLIARALLAAVEGSALTPRDERAVTDDGWQPIETAPRDGRAVLVQGSMYVHYMLGAKFPMLPYGWRPDTPQTAWVITGWQPLHEAPTEPRPSLSGREGEK